MKQKRKLRRFGSRTYGVTLGADMLNLMGTSVDAAESEEGVEVDVTIYGSTLIVRLADTPKPTPAELAYFISEDFEYAKFFPTAPGPLSKGTESNQSMNAYTYFREGKTVELTKAMQTTVSALAMYGPLAPSGLVERTGMDARVASRCLRSGFEVELFIREGPTFRLNPDVFDV